MKHHVRQTSLAAPALALSLLAFAPAAMANGGHSHDGGHGETAEDAGHGEPHGHGGDLAAGHPGEAGEVDRTIRVEARDTVFDQERIEVRANETIRFVIENTGELMHDFTIGTHETQAAHRREMAEMMEHNGDPRDLMSVHDHGDANAVMLAPGETKELIWTFEDAAEVEFACNVPGHYEAGMHGDIVIEERAGRGDV